ncbi:hypothetical protein [Carbonactinospora thermoautotrophica]|uniref:hypothetical protein n=1 Tax=Carbonactinospora thermoautotrophica TaxID=1469144 RepID=UPI00227171AF|nr:hypothetical protein [Carbonactinospora thermoautotrophica]
MKIRLEGTPDECQHAANRIRDVFDVLDVSEPYPDRPPSRLVRVYLTVRIPSQG